MRVPSRAAGWTGGARLLLLGALTASLLAATIASFWSQPTDASSDQTLVADGKSLFLAKGCIACHSLSVPGDPAFGRPIGPQLAPSLTNIAATAAARRPGQSAAEYLRESILDPQSFVVPATPPSTIAQAALLCPSSPSPPKRPKPS